MNPPKMTPAKASASRQKTPPCTQTTAPNVDEMSEEEWAEAHRCMMALVEEGAHLGGFKINREELYGRDNMKIIA